MYKKHQLRHYTYFSIDIFDLECIKQLYMQVKCLSENISTNSLTEPIVYILTGVTDHLVIVLANIFNFITITGNKQKWLSNDV